MPLSGWILGRRESHAGESHTYDYTYDAVGQLTDVAVDDAAGSHYDYDENGNLNLAGGGRRRGAQSDCRPVADVTTRSLFSGGALVPRDGSRRLRD